MQRRISMRMAVFGILSAAALFTSSVYAQDSQDNSTDDLGVEPGVPEVHAKVSIGFNYDWLRPPTKVSFDYPRGYIGLNIPFRYGLHRIFGESVTEGVGDFFGDDEKEFTPTATAQQYANTTIRVDVPMIGGVGSFANIQNFYLGYSNTLGEPVIKIKPDVDSTLSLFMRGMVGVPLDLSMAWETMVFGYAFKVNDNLSMALNLNRHLFKFDLHARVNVDLLGYFGIDIGSAAGGDSEELSEAGVDGISLEQDIDYSSHEVYGDASGHYEAEVWTPSIGIKFWRLGLTSRFGLKTKAPGKLRATYKLPFFIDPETFEMPDFTTDYLLDNYQRFINGDTDSLTYSTSEPLEWEMPQGHTITFDIIRDKLYLSYTKFFGEIRMALSGIQAERKRDDLDSAEVRSVGFDVGVNVDHITMLHGSFHSAFFNIGAFAMDLRYEDVENVLPDAIPDLSYAGGIVVPVLNFGTTMGSKMQLLLELDILPLTALKSGLIYHF